MVQEEDVKIRPYARLLTMLGDQLIKNEQIAVIELIKNSYDAEAEWVKVSFIGFGPNYQVTPNSKIVIEDNGIGMTKDVIKKAWMNPATPNKFARSGEIRRSVNNKRIIQGEKGIGRFAMLKLGRDITMTTRPVLTNLEYSVRFDLTSYDDNFLSFNNNSAEDLFLDELEFTLNETSPTVFIGSPVVIDGVRYDGEHNTHGTRIEIANLRGKWSEKKISDILESFIRFTSIFDSASNISESNSDDEMRIAFFDDLGQKVNKVDAKIQLQNLLNQKTVFRITNGHYDNQTQTFTYSLNSMKRELSLSSNDIKALRVFKDHFMGDIPHPVSDFGSFDFDFYVFDFNAKGTSRYALSPAQKELIKRHRIYLLRDGIRVLPYGDPDDDWLQIDTGRGTISAGNFFSNDQVVGRIKISKAGNPHLRDKTNREGLIEEELYTSDFICVIKAFLSYLRLDEYRNYLNKERTKKDIVKIAQEQSDDTFAKLECRYKDDPDSLSLLSSLRNTYSSERELLKSRMERSEHLAAVGLSVETSNHDIMMMATRSLDIVSAIKSALDSLFYDKETINEQLSEVLDLHHLIIAQLRDMQGLFVSSKQKPKWQPIRPLIDKIVKIYSRVLSKKGIDIAVDYRGCNLSAYCMDADIMQLLINLIDNSIYWLEVQNNPIKQIRIIVDGNMSTLIFSDNGCGIKNEDKDFIFDSFYSTKGEEGRGLGLYISQRLLERNGNSIRIASENEGILSGATFIVNFKEKE